METPAYDRNQKELIEYAFCVTCYAIKISNVFVHLLY